MLFYGVTATTISTGDSGSFIVLPLVLGLGTVDPVGATPTQAP